MCVFSLSDVSEKFLKTETHREETFAGLQKYDWTAVDTSFLLLAASPALLLLEQKVLWTAAAEAAFRARVCPSMQINKGPAEPRL